MDQMQLDKIRIAVLAKLPAEFLEPKIDISLHESFLADEMYVRVKGFVWGEKLGDTEIKYPRDWWQAFKKRWLPARALKYWPVVYTVHVISAAFLYPGVRPSLSDRPFTFSASERTSERYDNEQSATNN